MMVHYKHNKYFWKLFFPKRSSTVLLSTLSLCFVFISVTNSTLVTRLFFYLSLVSPLILLCFFINKHESPEAVLNCYTILVSVFWQVTYKLFRSCVKLFNLLRNEAVYGNVYRIYIRHIECSNCSFFNCVF